MNVSNVEVTAGLGGFLVLFGLALVVWFLGRDMSGRLRGLRRRETERLADLREQDVPQDADERSASRTTAEGPSPEDPPAGARPAPKY